MGRRLPAQLLDSVQVILVRVSLAELRREPFHARLRQKSHLTSPPNPPAGSDIPRRPARSRAWSNTASKNALAISASSRRSRFLLKVAGDQIGSSILSPMNHLTQSVNGLRTVRRSSITWPSWKSSE